MIARLFNESSKGVLLHTYLFPLHLGLLPSSLVVIVWNTPAMTQLPYLTLRCISAVLNVTQGETAPL